MEGRYRLYLSPHSTVVDKATGNYIACYGSLGISTKDGEDYDYTHYGPIAPSVVKHFQNCQHRRVRRYKAGDGKGSGLVHPFDVRLKGTPTHTDAPYCWLASIRKDNTLYIRERAIALFDMGRISRMSYLFSWPEV